MKKSIIALAVASASLVSVAQADNTTLYGSVEGTYKWSDTKAKKDNSNGVDTEVTVGIKGSEDLDNGISVFYDLKLVDEEATVVDSEDLQKALAEADKGNMTAAEEDKAEAKVLEEAKKYVNKYKNSSKVTVGLKGDFGTVAVGYNELPTSTVGKYIAPFEELGLEDLVKVDKNGGLKEANHSLAYVSPEFSGVQFIGGLVFDPATGAEQRGIDAYDVAVNYNANGFYAGLGVQGVAHSDFDDNAKVLGLGYGNDQFEVGYKTFWTDKVKKGNFVVAGKYNLNADASVYGAFGGKYEDLGDNFDVALGYKQQFGKASAFAEYKFDKENKDNKANSFALGGDYAFSKRTSTWAKFTFTDKKAGAKISKSEIEVGLKTSF